MSASGRSIEEIDAILAAAKLEKTDLLPVSQEITFDENFSGADFKLIELDKELAETVRVGNRLVFRGEDNEPAVLCTDISTYEIKEAETSNSLVILEELSFPEQARRTSGSTDSSASSKSPDSVSSLPVIPLESCSIDEEKRDEPIFQEVVVRSILDICHNYLELRKIKPNLSKVRTLLASSKYKGESVENQGESREYITLETLLEKVPASLKEIRDSLQSIRAFEINGYLRQIDDDYLFRVLSAVVSCIDENSWAVEGISKTSLVESLNSAEPPFMIKKTFELFFSEIIDEDGEAKLSYKQYELCRFFGEVLLKPVGRFNLKEFMKVWHDSVPEGLKVHLKQLEGLAVTNTDTSPAVIWYFPEYNLPEMINDRFAVLFETKTKWKLDEITPYLVNVSSASQSVGVLLTKFSRVSNINGIKFYSSKHSK